MYSKQMVHTTLLRQIEEQEILFTRFFCYEDGIVMLEKMQEQQGTSGYLHRKKELVKRLNAWGVDCSMATDDKTLEEYVNNLPACVEMERKLVNILYSIYTKTVTPAQQIERLVRRLGDPEFQTGSVRLAIVKQFISRTGYHTRAVVELITAKHKSENADMLEATEAAMLADESIFDVLDNKLTKDEKTRYTLLKLADDLASGRFKANGSTKTALYMFAFAFDMTACINSETETPDPDRDIERNLFHEYYANSVMRYASEDFNSRKSDYEAEPIGGGINYKNYAEVIYLYYLSRRDMSSRKKLSSANRAIAECTKAAKNNIGAEDGASETNMTTSAAYTYYYKDMYIMQVANLPEDELVSFICSHYETGEQDASAARITVNSKLKTASFHFNKMLRKNAKAYKSGQTVTSDVYGGIVAELTKGYEEPFAQVLNGMCRMLFADSQSQKSVGRAQLFNAVYYRILNDERTEQLSLLELSRKMREILDPMLEDSRLQPFSEDNIFDMFVVILLYRNLKL